MTTPNNQSSLQHWIDWLLQLHPKEVELGLDRIRLVSTSMQLLRPAPFVISVAGTNGKGSSVAMLVSILKAAGYQVGAYTSPHIQSFNERIQIDGLPVSDADITKAFDQIETARGGIKLTYFEFATLAALSVFKQASLDVVVLEVGLGGRLDAVNVVDADVALITAIGIDHVEWLGDDRSVIATEKAGITRSGRLAVCSDSAPPESLLVYAKQHAVPLMQLNKDFRLDCFEGSWSMIGLSEAFIKVSHIDSHKKFPPPSLKGSFQLQNAAGVVALLSLQDRLKISKEAICTGLQQAKHPGRLDSFQVQDQSWLVDVAHNPQSAQALAEYLEQISSDRSGGGYTAIFSVLNDKDALPMIQMIAPFVKNWVIVDLSVPRASSIVELTELLINAGVAKNRILPQETMVKAVTSVQKKPSTPILVWGSFFTVSQVYGCLDQRLDLL